MKKLLLAVSALLLVSAVFAQADRYDAKNRSVTAVAKKVQTTGFEKNAIPQVVSPMTRVLSHDFIGTTFYDCQTNAGSPNKVLAHPDGTISAVWTTCGEQSSTRGTGYNYFNGNSWVNSSSSTTRIESGKTGWGVIAGIGDAEIVIAHNGLSALTVNICPQKGSQEWIPSTLQGPAVSNGTQTSTCLLWPAVATSGNTIHLLACTESDEGYLYHGIQTCLLYYRGTFNASNNTITWENPRIVGDVTANEASSFSGDAYAIDAKDNTVAIVALPSMKSDAFLWKSTDNGVNFTKTVFLPAGPSADTNYSNDGACDVAIGDDGVVHVAVGLERTYFATDTSSTYTYWPGLPRMLYWNETQAPIVNNGSPTFPDADSLSEAGYTLFERCNLDCDDTIWGNSNFEYPNYGVSGISMPQLVAENGKVYLVFCQMMEYPFADYISDKYYRGIFATKSLDNGQTFGDYSWLSYNKDVYYLDNWSWLPFSSETYEAFRDAFWIEGENVYPAVASNLQNGNIVMTWQWDYTAGSAIKEKTNATETFLYALSMNADSIGIYNNTNEVCQGLWIDPTGISNKVISGMKMYPNPASDMVKVTFSSEESSNAVVSVMNLMGQTVYTNNVSVNEGYNMVTIPVNQFRPGVYMVNVKTAKGTSTQKLIVK